MSPFEVFEFVEDDSPLDEGRRSQQTVSVD
jgi:hypothetical protein